MCGDCRFADAVTPGYKIRSASEAVSGGHKNYSAGKTVSTGHKTGSVNFVPGRDKTAAVDSVSGGYKNAGADGKQTAVSTGDKNAAADSVSGGYKNAGADGKQTAVSTGDKNAAVDSVSGGYKNHSAGVSVTTGYKIHSAGEAVTTGYKIYSVGEVVSGGHKTGGANFVPGRDKTAAVDSVSEGYKTDAAAMTASAKYMDACAGAAWMLFAVTARNGMAWTVAGRGTFAVTGCFLLLPFGMRCAGCGYVVMNSFSACRDEFIFSWFVISFLPLKEPLRVRGDFSLLEVL